MNPESTHPITILFAHRGARAEAPENTMEAFARAVQLGATGLETDAWLTSDGTVVLDHDGALRGRFPWRSTPLSSVHADQLPDHIPTFVELFDAFGLTHDVSVDLKGPEVWKPIVDLVAQRAPDRLPHLWLCDPDIETLRTIRNYDDRVRLVHSIRSKQLTTSIEAWAQQLSRDRIDALNMRQPDWTAAMVRQVHKFAVRCFMWDVQTEAELATSLHIGIDGIYSDHVRKMVAAAHASEGPRP